jgi:hypothetical protein
MKKVIFLLAVFAVLSSCSKKEEQTPQFKEDGGKIQYPKGFYKAKIDDQLEKVNIIVDLSNPSESNSLGTNGRRKVVDTNNFIYGLYFHCSRFHYNSIFYSRPSWPDVANEDPAWNDLNQGAGGRYIYLYYSLGNMAGYPITRLWITSQSGNYTAFSCRNQDGAPADLNDGAGGLYIWVNQTFDYSPNHRMIGIGTIMGNTTPTPAGWEKIPYDLNKGAGGQYIYFIVKWA